MKLSFSDIISLTKAAYQKRDIDELLNAPVDEPEEPDQEPESTDDENGPEGGPEEYPEDDHKEPEKPDFEQLYKNLKTELDDVKKQLAAAQKANLKTNQDQHPDEKGQNAFDDIVRSFM